MRMLQQQQQKTILPSSVYVYTVPIHMYMALRSTGSEGVLREARGLPFTSAPELESLTKYAYFLCIFCDKFCLFVDIQFFLKIIFTSQALHMVEKH